MANRGQYLYVGCGKELRVFNTSSSDAKPVFIKAFDAAVVDVTVSGSDLYVAASTAGMFRFSLEHPDQPFMNGHHKPETAKQAATSIQLRHDTVWVSMGNEIAVLKSMTGIGATFDKVGAFGEHLQPKGGIVATALRGRYFAALHAGRDRGVGNGVHLFDLRNMQRVAFFQQPLGEPADLAFSPDGNLLLVAGGELPGGKGLFYGLDIRDPHRPKLAFTDTIRGPEGGIHTKRILFKGDTVLLAARQAWNVVECPGDESYVWAYALAPDRDIQRIGTLAFPGEVWDLALSGNSVWAALGASGIGRQEWPTVFGMDCKEGGSPWADTGEFCYASDAFGEFMAVALGHDGVAVFRQNAGKYSLHSARKGMGKVRNVKFNGLGTHLVAFVECPGGDSLVVLGADSLQTVSSYRGRLGHEHVHMWQDRFFVMLPGNAGFEVIDVRNPALPVRERGILVTLNAFGIDNLGHLILSSQHAIKVIDIHDGKYKELGRISQWGEGYGASVGWDGIYYVASAARGVVKLKLIAHGEDEFVLVETGFEKLPVEGVEYMAADDNGVYLAGNSFGMLMVDARNLRLKDQWGTPAAGLGQRGMGLRELFCWNGRIYWVDFMGGVKVLTAAKL